MAFHPCASADVSPLTHDLEILSDKCCKAFDDYELVLVLVVLNYSSKLIVLPYALFECGGPILEVLDTYCHTDHILMVGNLCCHRHPRKTEIFIV